MIVMDGVSYHLRVVLGSLEEGFRIEDGPNGGTLMDGSQSRDILGTYYDHQMRVEPDPKFYQDYIDFYMAISAPVDSHTITMPHGGEVLTYQAMVTSGRHVQRDTLGGKPRYTGLSVDFTAMSPHRRPQ